jgi:glucose dehydrogenase
MKQTIAQQIKWDFKTNGDLEIKDKNSKEIYYENSDGFWAKYEYDSDGNRIYYENSDGFWGKWEYDSQENVIYYENSYGTIIDNRPKPCENKVVEIEGIKYKLTKL